jgi:hypothetical protein
MLSVSRCSFVSVYGMYEYVFFITCSKVSTGLANILQVTAIAFYFIYSAMIVFVGVFIFMLKLFS